MLHYVPRSFNVAVMALFLLSFVHSPDAIVVRAASCSVVAQSSRALTC